MCACVYVSLAFSLTYTLQVYLPTQVCSELVLGFKVDKPSEFLIKTSNALEYIELNIKSIEAPIIDDFII